MQLFCIYAIIIIIIIIWHIHLFTYVLDQLNVNDLFTALFCLSQFFTQG